MRTRGNLILGLFLTAAAVCGLPQRVYADCSDTDQQSLLSCDYNSVVACRNSFPQCDDPKQSFTIQDALNRVGDRCCSITGSQATTRQRLCFIAEENRLTSMYRIRTTTSLRKVIKATRAEIKALRRAGCDTGSVN